MAKSVVAAGTLWLGGGCATTSHFRGLAIDRPAVFLPGVTPTRQDANYACGAACLASVAAYWGITLSEFREKLRQSPEDTTGPQLQALARSIGLQAFAYRGSLADLLENLRAGRPLILMLPKPPEPAPATWVSPLGVLTSGVRETLERAFARPHWVMCVGIDGDNRYILQDPASGLLSMEPTVFAADWKRMENMCVLVVAPPVATK